MIRRAQNKAECLGMKCLTWTELEAVLDKRLVTAASLTSQDFGSTIGLVHEERMTYLLHVGTNLMGTSCFQDALHQSGVTESL